jgi:hypothetical protein
VLLLLDDCFDSVDSPVVDRFLQLVAQSQNSAGLIIDLRQIIPVPYFYLNSMPTTQVGYDCPHGAVAFFVSFCVLNFCSHVYAIPRRCDKLSPLKFCYFFSWSSFWLWNYDGSNFTPFQIFTSTDMTQLS